MAYSIREVSRRTGLPASTLRYYETERLLPPVPRDGARRRAYAQEDLETIAVVTCLKNTGMPIQEIRRFMQLCRQGDSTLPERYRIVLAHRRATQERIARLQKELMHVNQKVAYYRAACGLLDEPDGLEGE
ncbi:MAG: MerR family transcriptional regulator [Clostridiales bacterium]|nr:MerR family transcriptional regulator [Clostridiales bacterium]